MAKVRHLLTEKVSLLVYKTTILPILDYGDVFHAPRTKIGSNKLQLIQNKALRTIYRIRLGPNPALDTEELHTKAQLDKLEHRRTHHLLLFASQMVKKGMYPPPHNQHTHYRMTFHLFPPRSNHHMFRSSFLYQAAQQWNKLPSNISSKLHSCNFHKILQHHLTTTLTLALDPETPELVLFDPKDPD